MTEKRGCPRRRRRLVVEWAADGFASAGFTHDLSATGMFVCSLHIPEREAVLTMNLALPDGRKIRLRGIIVRSYRVAPSLRRVRRSGFCVRLIEAPEDYFVLVADLLQLHLPEPEEETGEPEELGESGPCEEPEVLAALSHLQLPAAVEPEEPERSDSWESEKPENTERRGAVTVQRA